VNIIFISNKEYNNIMKSRENLIGAWAVLSGVIIAVILGIFQNKVLVSYNMWIYLLLAFLGVVIGFVSVSTNDSKEAVIFLLATISLVIVSSEGQQRLVLVGEVGFLMVTILNALLTMFVPATIVVALKTVFSIASVK
jgi:hypothetical protein